MKTKDKSPSISFWVVSLLLLLWGLAGAAIYVAYFVQSPLEFAQGAEVAAQREVYADYVANIPLWAIATGILAALARLFGAVALLLRRAWAFPLYVISIAFFSITLYRAFVLAGVARVMSGRHIATEVAFFALSVFAIWFAHRHKAAGTLK